MIIWKKFSLKTLAKLITSVIFFLNTLHYLTKFYFIFYFIGLSNEASYETLQALYEMRRSEVSRLEKELDEYKMQAEADIDNLRKNLLINESESQRIIVEYQQQCGNNNVIILKIII